MVEFFKSLIPGLWLAWLAFWVLAARGTKETVRQETAGSRFMHHAPLVAGAVLLGWPHVLGPAFEQRFHAHTIGWFLTGLPSSSSGSASPSLRACTSAATGAAPSR